MTRINTIGPSYLTDKHLVAEYRELPRVFMLITKWARTGCRGKRPKHFTLGAGHVRFFYDKPDWLVARFYSLVAEMRDRGFTVNHPHPPEFLRVRSVAWVPDKAARLRCWLRLRERERAQRHRWRGEEVEEWYETWKREIVLGGATAANPA